MLGYEQYDWRELWDTKPESGPCQVCGTVSPDLLTVCVGTKSWKTCHACFADPSAEPRETT